MRPIQLVREPDARAGAVARDVPVYEPGACAGCPQVPVCKERGSATVFLVHERKGQPVWCKKIGGNLVACKAQHMPALELVKEAPLQQAHLVLLCDASVFINAERWQWRQCQLVLERAGRGYRLATTRPILEELHYAYQLPGQFETFEVDMGRLHPRLLELARLTTAYEDVEDRASLRDLSLVQALLDHPGLGGILTEDADLLRLHTPSIVRELTGRATLLLTCEQFCRSKPALFPDYGHGTA
ncbi:MAG: hypothetical protein LC624_08810 [Halobacteriales archaeon]|nr:hypothetical protein [Halobacteriales archaeon]